MSLLTRSLIPIMWDLLFSPTCHSKVSPSNTITLGIRSSTHEFRRDTEIHSVHSNDLRPTAAGLPSGRQVLPARQTILRVTVNREEHIVPSFLKTERKKKTNPKHHHEDTEDRADREEAAPASLQALILIHAVSSH